MFRDRKQLVENFERQGTPLMPKMSESETAAFMAQESQRWKKLAQVAGIHV